MQFHIVQAVPSCACPPRSEQLAWNLAAIAADETAATSARSIDAVIHQLICNTGVALTALDHPVVANARSQAVAHVAALHPRSHGARIIGLPATKRYGVEWAAYANATAISASAQLEASAAKRAGYLGDTIPAVLAVAQQCGRDGADLIRGVTAASEIHTALEEAIAVDDHGVDSILHLAAAAVGGIGACLSLDIQTIYQSIQQALHTTTLTRLVRSGDDYSWTVCLNGHASKLAIEAVDRSMRGDTATGPIYESADGVLARLLGGAQMNYRVALPSIGEERCAIANGWAGLSFVDSHCRFQALADGVVSAQEQERFLQLVQRLPQMTAGELSALNVVADLINLTHTEPDGRGIF